MRFADRWLALIAAVICAAVAVIIATSPVVDNSDVKIPIETVVWARHWFEAGLAVFAAFFGFLHFAANTKKTP